MSFYLDANIIVALLTPDPLSARADAFLRAHPDVLIISDLGAAEFVSAVSRRVRMSEITSADGGNALVSLDNWLGRSAIRVETTAADIALADSFLRRLDLPLLTPDAIHIAIAQRIAATLVTADRQMAAASRALGIAVAAA